MNQLAINNYLDKVKNSNKSLLIVIVLQPQKRKVNMDFELMQDIRLLFLTIGVFLGGSLGIFLVLNESAKNKANRYLGVIALLILLFFLPTFFYRFNLLETFPHLIALARIFPFLFGPLMYFYVRACTQKGFEMRSILWLHFIPAFLMFLHCTPQIFISGEEKVANHLRFLKTGVVDYPWIWLLKVIHAMIYFAISTKLVLLYRQHIGNTTSAIDKAFHRWLLTCIVIFALPILGLLGFVSADLGPVAVVVMSVGLVIFLITIYVATLIKPELFHAFPHQMPIPESTEDQKTRYENSNLQAVQKEKYLEKILTFMKSERPFEESELTLAQLAEKIKVPSYHVSQVINEKLDCNFLDFINGYRVKAAQEKLLDPKLSHYTIIGIAHEAGFNSKSTFYTAFKKVTGMTPSQYRKKRGLEVA